MNDTPGDASTLPAGWRLYLGLGLFGLSLGTPVFIPLIAVMGLSGEVTVVISGLLIFGIPQVLMVGAIVALGKPGFQYLKSRFGGWLKRFTSTKTVGRIRYRIGLMMFFLPILLGFLSPYIDEHVSAFGAYRFMATVAVDAMFVASLFVLGGDFWDKLRALFLRDAKAIFPDTPSSAVSSKVR